MGHSQAERDSRNGRGKIEPHAENVPVLECPKLLNFRPRVKPELPYIRSIVSQRSKCHPTIGGLILVASY